MKALALTLAVLGGLTLLLSAGLYVLGVLPSLETHGSLVAIARTVMYAAIALSAGGLFAAVRAKSIVAGVLSTAFIGLPIGMMIASRVLTEA
jgi:hypothetical protein